MFSNAAKVRVLRKNHAKILSPESLFCVFLKAESASMKEFIKNYKYHILKFLVLAGISFFYLDRSFNEFKEPVILGDGMEYVMMTEALKNHFTPDMQLQDVIKFKKRYSKYIGWNNPVAPVTMDGMVGFIKDSKHVLGEGAMGYYWNKNGRLHCSHFFFYSLVNVPAYSIFKKQGPIRSFAITNAFLIIITCFILLFYTPFPVIGQVFTALCFCYSACYWYLAWQHAEVYTCSMVAIAMVALFNRKNYLAIFMLSLACLQNQPLILLLGLFCLIAIEQRGFNLKNLIKIGSLAVIAFIPPIYYYINFNSTNLIKDAGFLDTKFITYNRVSGFYTDVSQGMILTIPLLLLIYLPLLGIEIKKVIQKQKRFHFSLLIPVALILITCTVSTMENWNHGMAIINRYASWMSIIVMFHVFYLTNALKKTVSIILFSCYFMSQAATTLYHQQFNIFDGSSSSFTPLAKWFLNKHEKWYNPDPYIFAGRAQIAIPLLEENSPIIYFHKKQAKKILVHRNKIDQLKEYGFSDGEMAQIKNKISYNFDWGYVDMDVIKSTVSQPSIYQTVRKKRVEKLYQKIGDSAGWMEQIKMKAERDHRTVDEFRRLDAEFIISEQEKAEDKE
jgi:hypothetical protein